MVKTQSQAAVREKFERRQIEFKRQNITAFQRNARPVYLLKWVNRDGKRVTVSLGTRHQTEAKTIALALEQMANALPCWSMDATDPRLAEMHPKAKQIFFGLDSLPIPNPSTIRVRESEISRQQFGLKSGYVLDQRHPDVVVPNKELDDERKKRIEDHRELVLLRTEKESWSEERLEYRSKLNKHCKKNIEEALITFEEHYKAGHDGHTVKQVLRVNREFMEIVGKAHLVGQIKGIDLNRYLDGYKDDDGEDVTQTTKRKVKAYLSTFWSWAVKQYQLNGNPMEHVHSVVGESMREIRAIADWEHFKAYLDAFKDVPYWHAWAAFACLVGPRWWEQANALFANVHLDSGYVTLMARKTKRPRNVPIEKTILLPILKEYIETHSEESPLLFPSLVDGHGAAEDGAWRASTWHKWWGGGKNPDGKIVEGVIKQIQRTQEKSSKLGSQYWNYGPDEWRHCAGTAMGHSGLSALRISQWLGNSERIARDHYIAPIGGALWPLRWTAEPLV